VLACLLNAVFQIRKVLGDPDPELFVRIRTLVILHNLLSLMVDVSVPYFQ